MTLINKVNEGKYDNRNGKGNFGGWCRTVIKNKMNDSVRKKIVRSNRSPLHYMLDEFADDEPLENDTIEDSLMDKFLKINYDRVKRIYKGNAKRSFDLIIGIILRKALKIHVKIL